MDREKVRLVTPTNITSKECVLQHRQTTKQLADGMCLKSSKLRCSLRAIIKNPSSKVQSESKRVQTTTSLGAG